MNLSIETAIALVIATAILGLSPGPAVFATVARSIVLPFRKTALFILGIIFADFIFAFAAMSGVSLLFKQNEIYFWILKLLGGGYLIYLGVKGLISKSSILEIKSVAPEKGWRLFGSGFLLTAGNPKDLLFFVSFLPAFVDLQRVETLQMIVVATLIALTFTGTLSFYALLVRGVERWLNNPKVIWGLDKLASGILIIVGLVVLFFN